jgi:AraC-like DNA-binding protein
MRRAPDPTEIPYTEVAPPADLARHVDRFWLRTTLRPDPVRPHRVLPDGCVDVIVNVARGSAELVGTMTRAQVVPEAPAEIIAVRFRPGTAAAVAGRPLAELTDHNPRVAELGLPESALIDAVSQAGTTQARLAVLAGWVRDRIAGAGRPDPLVAHAVAWLSAPERAAEAATRVELVARRLGVTRQHLARLFRREVGITPKELARIARVQRATAAIERGGAELAQIALELGYFDQSHLAHDVRELIGVTPGVLAAERPIALPHLFEAEVPILQSSARGGP